MLRLALFAFLLSALSAQAATKGAAASKGDLRGFDLLFMPQLSMGFGDFKMGTMDEGKYYPPLFGVRGGFKIGPVFLGGEYLEGKIVTWSDKSVSSTNRIGHPNLNWARQQTWAWSGGLFLGRFILMYNYAGYNRIKQNSWSNSQDYNFTYDGFAHRYELGVRLHSYVYLSGHWRTQEFDKYSTTYAPARAKLEPLNPKLTTSDWGVNIFAVLPISEVLDRAFKK